MGSFGGTEILFLLIGTLLPSIFVIGYFLWLGSKVSKIAKAQEDQSRHLREIVSLLREES